MTKAKCVRYKKGELAWGDARFGYVSINCLSSTDRSRAKSRYPYKDIAPDTAYFYPVKKDGTLAKARRASLPLSEFRKRMYKK